MATGLSAGLESPVDGVGYVGSATDRPVSSTRWILMHPHRGLSLAIRQMSSWSSASIGGRPVRFARLVRPGYDSPGRRGGDPSGEAWGGPAFRFRTFS